MAVLVLAGVGLSTAAPAQAQTRGFVADYAVKRWTTGEGLPHNWMTDVLQTRDGYLWLGTNNAGFVRFDGLHLETFNLLNTPALKANHVTRLHEDGGGTLWIATVAGLVRYDSGTFVSEVLPDVLPPGGVIDLSSDNQGRLLVATTGQVLRREGESWSVLLRVPGIMRVASSPDGTIWVGTESGLVEWRDGAAVRRWTERDGLPSEGAMALLEDRAGRLWIGTSRGVASLDRRTGRVETQPGFPADERVRTLFEDSAGVLWIGGVGRVFRRQPDGTLTESLLTSDTRRFWVAAIREDRDHNVWVGVEGWNGGLYRFRRQSVSSLPDDRLPCGNIGAITQAKDGTTWLSTFCDSGEGVLAIRGTDVVHYPGPSLVMSLFVDVDGSVWAGTYGGRVFRFAGGRFEEVDSPTQVAEVVTAFHRDRDGVLWVATSTHGVYRQRAGQWTSLTVADGLPSNDVRTITPAPDGSVWIGANGGVSRYDDGRLTTYSIDDGVPPGPIRAIHVDAQGVVWIGSYGGGLARLKNGVVVPFGIQAGLLDTSVHRILEDAGYFWVSGDRGIRRISKSDLDTIADGHDAALDVVLFDEADGLRSAEANGMAQPAGWRMDDGVFYFPTQAGVARIDPAVADSSSSQVPLIEGVSADGSGLPMGDEIVVAPGYGEIEIRFTTPTFVRPEIVQFRYRLQGTATSGSRPARAGRRRSPVCRRADIVSPYRPAPVAAGPSRRRR